MAVTFWLRRPRMLLARLRYRAWERSHPDKPWLCPGTVAFCEAHTSRSMTALEFGSGRSTRWLSSLVGHLTSVEHDKGWYEKVRRGLDGAGADNVTYLLVPLDHPESEPERDWYSPVPAYVAVADGVPDGSLGLAVVDGHYRTQCIRRLVSKVAPNGYLLVDDVNLWPSVESLPVPPGWRVADDSTNGVKRCVVWQAPPPAGRR
jgi:hypothetical protein